MLRLKVL
jgi:hypothetical protein